MGKSVTKGWTKNNTTGKFDFNVFNASSVEKTVFDEDGRNYQLGTAITATAAEINTSKMYEQSVLFTEAGAGTYTGAISLPAGAVIKDIIVHAIAVWAAGVSAAMNVGDATTANGYFAAVNLKATDLLADESISFEFAGGKQGADLDVCGTGFHVRRRYAAAARVISGVITSVGAGTTGRTLMTVIYAVPVQNAAVKS